MSLCPRYRFDPDQSEVPKVSAAVRHKRTAGTRASQSGRGSRHDDVARPGTSTRRRIRTHTRARHRGTGREGPIETYAQVIAIAVINTTAYKYHAYIDRRARIPMRLRLFSSFWNASHFRL